MAYELNTHQFEEVMGLSGEERYRYFIRRVADWEELWTLRDPDGFVLLGDEEQHECVPLWPHPDFAAALATGTFSRCTPERIELATFRESWIPGIQKEDRRVVVFPTPSVRGVVVPLSRLAADISEEIRCYE